MHNNCEHQRNKKKQKNKKYKNKNWHVKYFEIKKEKQIKKLSKCARSELNSLFFLVCFSLY